MCYRDFSPTIGFLILWDIDFQFAMTPERRRQQTIAMVDTETGEFTEKTLSHEGNAVREFYAALEPAVVVGIEATGAMQTDFTLALRAL